MSPALTPGLAPDSISALTFGLIPDAAFGFNPLLCPLSLTPPHALLIGGGSHYNTLTEGELVHLIPEAQPTFNQLMVFIIAPILVHPEPSKLFIVEANALNVTIGPVSSQQVRPCNQLLPSAFYSRKLSLTKWNYASWDKELLAPKAAFEEWFHVLEGAQFPVQVPMDHKNLEYLYTSQNLNHCQICWSLFFA